GQVAECVDESEILSAIGVYDHRGLERRRLVRIPEIKILSVALERDFDEMGHTRCEVYGLRSEENERSHRGPKTFDLGPTPDTVPFSEIYPGVAAPACRVCSAASPRAVSRVCRAPPARSPRDWHGRRRAARG